MTRQLNNRTLTTLAKKIKPIAYLLLLIATGVAFLNSYMVHLSRKLPLSKATSLELEESRDAFNRSVAPAGFDKNFVVTVVEKALSAVVHIQVSQTVTTELPPTLNEPLLQWFFGDQQPTQSQEQLVSRIGSGFVINPNGQIITNTHVVHNADAVSVLFPDGRSFEGEVLGTDPVTDIAVLQIQANNLPTVELGNSEQVQPGDWAIAIGSPQGLQKSISLGIVSATARSTRGYIQTDAAINPGSSGGPLLNARGQVIGVNTAFIHNASIGLAVPINTAQRIAQQLIAQGKVERRYLGIQVLPLTPEIKQQFSNNPNSSIRIKANRGVLVVRTIPGSAADKAGLRAGDVIQTINNHAVTRELEIQQIIENSKVGSHLRIKLLRNRKLLQLKVRPEPLLAPPTE